MLKVSLAASGLLWELVLQATSLLLWAAKGGLQLAGGLILKSGCLVSLTGESQEKQGNVPCGFGWFLDKRCCRAYSFGAAHLCAHCSARTGRGLAVSPQL